MRTQFAFLFATLACAAPAGWAAESAVKISVPVAAKSTTPAFDEARLTYVQSWIRQKAPECPPEVTTAAATAFLQELQDRQPQRFDQLLSPSFPVREFDSMLLRQVGAQLTAPAQTSVREQIARRRLQAALAAEPAATVLTPSAIEALMAKIKDGSAVQYRRLLEGRIEEDDLALLLKKTRQAESAGTLAAKPSAPPKAKVLTSADIVSEFARRNQEGSALQRLRSYTVEGRLKTAAGEDQQLILSRLRPDRYRMAVMVAGTTKALLAFDGERHWQQSPGQPPFVLKPESVGTRRYLSEFIDPLFAEEGGGYTYERLEDGVAGTQKFHRIQVRRGDGSKYVARIDPESFREVGRENDDKSTAGYSDFRTIAGVTFAFHEEVVDATGRKGTFDITRISPNPGLIDDYFEPVAQREPGYFTLERALARAPVAGGGN
jgi:hypothetical protein